MHSSINLFHLFSLLVLFFNPENMLLSSCSETKLFDLNSLPHGYLTFLGDSHLRHSEIALTKEATRTDAPRSAGVVLYNRPILSRDSHSKNVPSFYTKFAFYIDNVHGDDEEFGDGLAFLISPGNDLLGSPGYLGLVDSTDLNRNKFIAIEFDTKCDSIFQDPDDNHVGLDINNLFSVKLARSSSLGVDMKSGNLIVSWIDYKSHDKRLEVFLSGSHLKPKTPLLKADIDLSDYLKENMFVGFSAATEGSMHLIHIEQWEFTIMEFSPPPPPPSLPESGKILPNPSESGHRHSHLSRFAVAFIVGVCSAPFIVLCSSFCWKKLMGMIQKSGGTNNIQMQTIKSSGACQEIQFSIGVDEVATGFKIEKVIENELIRMKMVKFSIPLCNSLPEVKRSILSFCDDLPHRTTDVTSG